jgi:prepilin-type N-terminal cleavage/methylation domain-containing protein
MKKTLLRSSGGLTLVELVVTVAILSILVAIVAASYDTVTARVRASKVKGDMDGIAIAGYTDFTYNGDWALISFNAMPPSIQAEGLLRKWPSAPCPGMYYSWDNLYPTSNAVRVTLRRANNTALWSYCVDTYGGGNCQAADLIFGGIPIEISKTKVTYLYCNQ